MTLTVVEQFEQDAATGLPRKDDLAVDSMLRDLLDGTPTIGTPTSSAPRTKLASWSMPLSLHAALAAEEQRGDEILMSTTCAVGRCFTSTRAAAVKSTTARRGIFAAAPPARTARASRWKGSTRP